MTIIADWIMVHSKSGEYYQAVKNRNGEKLMRVSELQEMANDVIEMGSKLHGAYNYLFKDLLIVQQGVFKWNEKSNSFKRVSENYDGISEPKPLERKFLKIGDKIIKFVERLGNPINQSDTLFNFDTGNINSSYLSTVIHNDEVYHISLTIRNVDKLFIKMLAEQFLLEDAKATKSVEDIIIPSHVLDVPMDVYEFYSHSVFDKGFVKDNSQKGYITIYIVDYKDEINFEVILGREEAIQ